MVNNGFLNLLRGQGCFGKFSLVVTSQQKYEANTGNGAADDRACAMSAAGGNALAALGQAPPCKSYKALVTFRQYEELYTLSITNCHSQDELKAAADRLKSERSALLELLALSKSAAKDAHSALTALRKDLKSKACS
eukprot:6125386-Amphidinium_carterae.2